MNSSCRKRRLKALAASYDDDDDASSVTPKRDCRDLLVVATTLRCAWRNLCVPCAYKIATFDVALDYSFCKRIPNQRPELCPRSTTDSTVSPSPVLGYGPEMNVLTVGDGDFSFSLALARFGCNVTATSYETKETVVRVYQSVGIEATLSELEASSRCSTAYCVDATNLQETLPLTDCKFDRIVWNFPCSAVAKGHDGQNQEMEDNKELVRRFVDNARSFLSPNGQVHINHKTKPPFNQWKLEEIAVSAVSAATNVRYFGRVVLDRFLYPPYVPRKALDRKSFPCHDACTYIFDMQEQTENRNTDKSNNPLTAMAVSDPSKVLDEGDDIAQSAKTLVAVTPDLILSIRARLLEQKNGARHIFSRKKGKRKR